MSRKTTHIVFIALAVVLVPFCILSSGRLQIGQHYGFLLFGCAMIAALLSNRWIKAFIWYLCIWQAVFLAATINTPTVIATRGLFALITISVGALIFYYVSTSGRSNDFFINAICIGAIIQSIICIPQIIGYNPIANVLANFIHIERLDAFSTGEFKGLFNQAWLLPGFGTLGLNNAMAAYAAISFPFFLRPAWKRYLPLLILILLVSRTTTAIAALLVGLCVYYNKEKYILYCIPLVIVYSIAENWRRIFLHDVFSLEGLGAIFLTGRNEEWIYIFQQIMTSLTAFIFGVGPGRITGTQSYIHSEYLSVFFQFGLIGLIILFGYIATIDRTNRMLFSAFIIAAIDAMAFYPMHHPVVALIIVVIMGLLEREKTKNTANYYSSDQLECYPSMRSALL